MEDILDRIIRTKRQEVEISKAQMPLNALQKIVDDIISKERRPKLSMKESLENSHSGIISEFKRKSPSKGWIHENSSVEDIAPAYAKNGASAISILTDHDYFGGDLGFIEKVRDDIHIPILRKDFIIDEYQLWEARKAGANAVLLIAACLTKDTCRHLLHQAHLLGLEVLLEIHDEKELDYLSPETDMLGVNNRNLGSFHTDVKKSFDIIDKLPKEFTLVSESGISSPDMVKSLRKVGYKGFLIGENFMKEDNPGIALQRFIQQIEN
ncbi:MAG: indole-3-glycerol phosphate synthase TrpC [Bacteroidales bacterium]|nr:indole-3-glycerol phosphate synthase TrpC [Bacteroidales bacterium]